MLRYNLRYQLFLAASDVLFVIVALALSTLLRLNIPLGMRAAPEIFYAPPALYIIAAAAWVFAYAQVGVYSAHGGTPFFQTLRRIITGHVVATLIFLGALYMSFRDFSRLQVFYFVTILFALVLLHRLTLTALRSRILRYVNTERVVVIVGVSPNAKRVGEAVQAGAQAGLKLAGYVKTRADDPVLNGLVSENEILGTVEDLPQIVKQRHAGEVIVAVKWFDQQASDLVTRIMYLLEQEAVNIRLAPDYSELAYFRATPEDFNGLTLVGLRESILTPMQRIIKRLFDIAFSLMFLIAAWPLFLIVAIVIRLDSPGPIIFRQTRVGQHGRRFTIYKFRTMYANADQILPPEEAVERGKGPHDPRVTRVGAFLRRTSIDELPQFINVLKGDMSIVGPRPEVSWLAAQYEWWQRKRFEVPQGITGWWQVNGRSDKPLRFHIEDDLFYVRNYSIWLDLQIILRTLIVVFTRRGAY